MNPASEVKNTVTRNKEEEEKCQERQEKRNEKPIAPSRRGELHSTKNIFRQQAKIRVRSRRRKVKDRKNQKKGNHKPQSRQTDSPKKEVSGNTRCRRKEQEPGKSTYHRQQA